MSAEQEEQQKTAPLLAAMTDYAAQRVRPYHTPGHKYGKGMHPVLRDIIGDKALTMDVSLMSELDDPFNPQTCIKEAQELAAELYGAEHSFFMVNGTTGGIYAIILAVAGPGDKVIVPRNAHRSIIGGIILSGAIPVFLQPEIDTEVGLAMGITPETVAKTLEQHRDAKAVILINPTYYGVAADLKTITDLIHRYGMAVLVDEAHGPHLKFSDRLPMQALDAGVDLCAQSTHKILGAMTQCSMVHCQGTRVNVSRLKAMLQLVQSTSPNYLLLASLDVARMQMATAEGRQLLEQAIELSLWLRKEINRIPGLYCFGAEKLGNPGVFSLDPTKITVTVKKLGLTGAKAEKILRQRFNIQAELSDMYNILFLLTIGDGQAEAQALLDALKGLQELCVGHHDFTGLDTVVKENVFPEIPTQAMSPREALFSNTRFVLLDEAENKICAEIVTFYPPGIPVLCPGERISAEVIAYCRRLQAGGLKVSGPEDYTLTKIKVVE